MMMAEIAIASCVTAFDISGGRRELIEEEEAEELRRPLREPGNSYTKIRLSFGLGASKVAAPILRLIKDQLTEVDLSDLFLEGHRKKPLSLEVINMFSEGGQLRYLNLSNNALGKRVLGHSGHFSNHNNLEELYLMNGGISEEAAQAVLELIPSTKKLRLLHFHNNMTGDEGAVAIAELVKHSPALEDFQCSSTRVDLEGGIALANALGECNYLKKLDLCDSMCGVEAGVALLEVLSAFPDD